MDDSVIISAVLFVAAVFFIAVILPRQEEKKKAAKDAAEIAMEFAGRRPTLFQIDGTDEYGRKMVVYALFPCSDGADIFACDHYRILTTIYAKAAGKGIPDAEYKKANKYISAVKSTLPFYVPSCLCNIKWNTFEKYKMK